jgi:hypothetical protein
MRQLRTRSSFKRRGVPPIDALFRPRTSRDVKEQCQMGERKFAFHLLYVDFERSILFVHTTVICLCIKPSRIHSATFLQLP